MQTTSQPELKTSNLPIHIQGVSKRYGSPKKGRLALDNVDLSIQPGVFGLLGRNGAGKSTLLQILATLLVPTKGRVQIGPYDAVKQREQVRELVGFLPQDQGFYATLTVLETLRYLAALQGLERPDIHIAEVLDAVNLRDRARTRVGALSGGMRRRLGLAQALLGNPPVLIVDEPTAGLDPVEQQRFRTLLARLAAQGNRTILLSTHIIGDVATIASHLAVLDQGKMLFQGTVPALTEIARERCWSWRTTIARIEALRERRELLISSLHPITDDPEASPDQVIARVIGEQPDAEAVPVAPTLEDGYFSLIGVSEADSLNSVSDRKNA
uniref:ABC transporter ATP-binding protein n=1 Tax=Thermosporothrix sp. COM3 TaxID=2490863 RepID=A0A455SGW0_9CHLR|nr:ABC transporter ATP-binding protein [Thermosporothrix sp. COM3]